MTVSINEMYADRYKLRQLDREMNLLGDRIIRLENMRDRSHASAAGIALCNRRIEEIAYEQDVINDKISDLLEKYDVTYHGTSSFSVCSGNKYYTVICEDGTITEMSRLIIVR